MDQRCGAYPHAGGLTWPCSGLAALAFVRTACCAPSARRKAPDRSTPRTDVLDTEPTDQRDPIRELRTVPRSMAFLFGVLLIVPGVFLLGAAIGVSLLAASDDRLIGLAISVGSALGALLCFSISRRLITNRSRPDGGLVSPAFLLGSAALFAFLPLFALATGSWRSIKTAPEMTAIQMTMYFWIATVLFRLARARKAGGSEPSSAGSSGPALARLAAERR